MKHILLFAVFCVTFLLNYGTALSQTVSRSYVAPSSVSVDGVGNYGRFRTIRQEIVNKNIQSRVATFRRFDW